MTTVTKIILGAYIVCLTNLVACKKEVPYNEKTSSKDNAVVFVQQATVSPQELILFPFIDEARTFSFNAGFGAVGYPDQNITVKFEIDNVAFDSVNQARQVAGLPLYIKFPADAYTIDAMEATIPAGALRSNPLVVKYFSKKFDPVKSYLLPISIKDASGYAANPKVKTVFIIGSKLQGKAVPTATKITWAITADTEELVGEGPVNGRAAVAIDGDINTFWHSSWSAGEPPFPHWLNINMKQPYFVDKIEMAPRQNNANGFAKFKLEGSLDGVTWTMLANNLVFDPANKSFQAYTITPQQLQYIKVTMTEGRTPALLSTHLAEINVFKY